MYTYACMHIWFLCASLHSPVDVFVCVPQICQLFDSHHVRIKLRLFVCVFITFFSGYSIPTM